MPAPLENQDYYNWYGVKPGEYFIKGGRSGGLASNLGQAPENTTFKFSGIYGLDPVNGQAYSGYFRKQGQSLIPLSEQEALASGNIENIDAEARLANQAGFGIRPLGGIPASALRPGEDPITGASPQTVFKTAQPSLGMPQLAGGTAPASVQTGFTSTGLIPQAREILKRRGIANPTNIEINAVYQQLRRGEIKFDPTAGASAAPNPNQQYIDEFNAARAGWPDMPGTLRPGTPQPGAGGTPTPVSPPATPTTGAPSATQPTPDFGAIDEQDRLFFESLSKYIGESRQRQADIITGAPTVESERERLYKELVEPTLSSEKKLRTLAENLNVSLEQLPTDTARATQDFLVTEAQRRRRETQEREPLMKQLATTLAGQRIATGERESAQTRLESLMGAKEQDLARVLQAQQLLAAPQEELYKSAIERQMARQDRSSEGKKTERLGAMQLFFQRQHQIADAGIPLDPRAGEEALKRISKSDDPYAEYQKYLMESSRVEDVKKTFGPKPSGAGAGGSDIEAIYAKLMETGEMAWDVWEKLDDATQRKILERAGRDISRGNTFASTPGFTAGSIPGPPAGASSLMAR